MYLIYRFKFFFDFMEVIFVCYLWDIGFMWEVFVGLVCLGLEIVVDSIFCGREVCLKILFVGWMLFFVEMGLICGDWV